jgi:hypothetical protein
MMQVVTTLPTTPHHADEWFSLSVRLRERPPQPPAEVRVRSDVVLRVRISKEMWGRTRTKADRSASMRFAVMARVYSWLCQ